MRRALLLLILVFSLAFAGEIKIENPKLVKELGATVYERGRITIPYGELYEITINITHPQERSYQTISHNQEEISDGKGNTLVRIHSDDPPNPFEYSFIT